jgi:hypothetical protein
MYEYRHVFSGVRQFWTVAEERQDRKRIYLVSSFLDPHTKIHSFCDNKYFPLSLKDDTLGYLSIHFESFNIQPTQGEVSVSDGQVNHRSDLDKLLGIRTTSMDFDVSFVEGESLLQAYMQVQQTPEVPNDTDPLMWWILKCVLLPLKLSVGQSNRSYDLKKHLFCHAPGSSVLGSPRSSTYRDVYVQVSNPLPPNDLMIFQTMMTFPDVVTKNRFLSEHSVTN